MEFVIFIMVIIGITSIAVMLRSKIEKISMDESWKKHKEMISNIVNMAIEEIRDPYRFNREDVSLLPDFNERLKILFDRVSTIPVDAFNGVCSRWFDEFWHFRVRIVCPTAKQTGLFSGALENLIRESLVEEGFAPITYVSVKKDDKILDMYWIEVLYGCSDREKSALNSFVNNREKRLVNASRSVVDDDLNRVLDSFDSELKTE